MLYLDDGTNTGVFASIDEAQIANKNYLRTHKVTFQPLDAGKTFRYILEAQNEIGSAQSSIGSQLLAGVPAKPDQPLVSDPNVTNQNKIKVFWTTPSDTGGSEIQSYSLEIDDGAGGDFTAVVGEKKNYLRLDYTIEEGIERATNYRLRYRAKNQIGWGEYSEIIYILSATTPMKPPRPTMIFTSSTSITLSLQQTTDDGGSPIIGYKLLVDKGNDFTSKFSEIPRYSTFTSPFTVTIADDGLVKSKIYRFVLQAQNIYGFSPYSLEVIVGLGDKSPAPQNLRVELLPRKFDSFLVKWDLITVSDLPTLGYVLLMDDGLQGELNVVYDGSFNPQLTEYLIVGLEAARTYSLEVYATNINGKGYLSATIK